MGGVGRIIVERELNMWMARKMEGNKRAGGRCTENAEIDEKVTNRKKEEKQKQPAQRDRKSLEPSSPVRTLNREASVAPSVAELAAICCLAPPTRMRHGEFAIT